MSAPILLEASRQIPPLVRTAGHGWRPAQRTAWRTPTGNPYGPVRRSELMRPGP